MNTAKVELISVSNIRIYKWLRLNHYLGVHDAYLLSKNGSIIDFYGDMKKAISLYDYIYSFGTSSARLIIDNSFDTRGFTGGNCF